MAIKIMDRPIGAKACYTREDFETRLVTDEDKWCTHKLNPSLYQEFQNYSPYGSIVIIPEYYDGMLLELDGCIIKSKFDKKGILYLQVIEAYRCWAMVDEYPQYMIRIDKEYKQFKICRIGSY